MTSHHSTGNVRASQGSTITVTVPELAGCLGSGARVDATIVQTHLHRLVTAGVRLAEIGKRTGLSRGAVEHVYHGRRRTVPADHAEKIFAITVPGEPAPTTGQKTPETVDGLLVSWWVTRMVAAGFRDIVTALNQETAQIVAGSRPVTVTARTAELVSELWDELMPAEEGPLPTKHPWTPAPAYRRGVNGGVHPDDAEQARRDHEDLTAFYAELAEILEDRLEPWRSRAACRPGTTHGDGPSQEWTARFFPGRGDVIDETARRLCASCPVAAECNEYALRRNQPGLWHTTGRERREQRRLEIAAEHATVTLTA